jgi:hypothetical protein
MATAKAVLNKVKAVLDADATLAVSTKAYIQRIDLGLRKGLARADFPCIQIEPGVQTEIAAAYPNLDCHLLLHVIAYTHVFDIPTLLTGDANYKGVLDLEQDIKKALGALFPTLGLTDLIEFTFPRTEFTISENVAEFPVRGVIIDMDCHYRTDLGTRA